MGNGEIFTCQYETRINDFGGRALRTKKVRAETAEAAVQKLWAELEARGERVIAIKAEGKSGTYARDEGDPTRDL